MRYFGRPRPAKGFQEMELVDRPRNATCGYCGEPIHDDQDGVIDDQHRQWHAECWLLQILRRMSPSAGLPEIGRQTLRQAAVEVVTEFEREGRL